MAVCPRKNIVFSWKPNWWEKTEANEDCVYRIIEERCESKLSFKTKTFLWRKRILSAYRPFWSVERPYPLPRRSWKTATRSISLRNPTIWESSGVGVAASYVHKLRFWRKRIDQTKQNFLVGTVQISGY